MSETLRRDHLAAYVDLLAYLQDSTSSVFIKDFQRVSEKLRSILDDGSGKVHVISDFDMTISKYWVNGERNVSSHRLLALSSRVPKEFSDKTDLLYKHYYPIEISRTTPHKEKVQAMVEWWEKAHELILELKLTKNDLEHMVTETPILLRMGAREFVDHCAAKDIPLLVFSAGLGDVIDALLRHEGLMKPNVHIVSNRLHFGEDGLADRFDGRLIHTFNKNEAAIGGSAYSSMIEGRHNVILMGDSLGDLRMAEGLEHDTKITIGFLNHDTELLLDQYAEAFDIVILDDAPMDVVNRILAALP
ncbi:5'-nucleotidase [Spizellomyces sp. 'palustris']|nr:5'-nucleotidase [Spizellomyces sp. 'palustris']